MKRRSRNRMSNPSIRTVLIPKSSRFDPRSVSRGIRRRHLELLLNIVDAYHLTHDLLEAVLHYFEPSDRRKLIDRLYDPAAVDEDGDRDDQYEDCLERIHDVEDVARYILDDFARDQIIVKEKEFIDLLKKQLLAEFRKLPAGGTDELDDRIEELGYIFRFTEDEKLIMGLLFAIYEVQADIIEDILNNIEYNDFLRFMSLASGIDYQKVKRIISKRGSLYRSGIISDIQHNRRDFIEFEDRIAEYLSGIGDVSLTERFIKRDTKKVLPLEYFDLPGDSFNAVESLLADNRPCNILLAGVAGTGKTEFARSIGRSTGKPVFTLNVGGSERNRAMSLKHDEENAMYVSFRAAEELVATSGGILIADEMDIMLNRSEKGWLNLYLDSSRAKIVWIANSISWVEESTMRRFNYVVNFDKLTSRDRIKIWNNILGKNRFRKYLKKETVKRLAAEHHINAGGIAHALSNLDRTITDEKPDPADVIRQLEHFLDAHRQQITKRFSKRKSPLNALDRNYDPSILNTSVDVDSIIREAKRFGGGLLDGSIAEGNMNLLLSGQPGTGKTEFVKYLARTTSLEFIVKRYSDLVSPYVGETEINIAAAFREAEKAKGILFIDEADSLFATRENARYRWETSTVNELLNQMENFTGILVCSTNFLPNVDLAAMRRFQWKVTFKPMKSEKRLELYKTFFDFITKALTTREESAVLNLEALTPGDMKAVREQKKYMKNLTHAEIIAALEEELKYKVRERVGKVGF